MISLDRSYVLLDARLTVEEALGRMNRFKKARWVVVRRVEGALVYWYSYLHRAGSREPRLVCTGGVARRSLRSATKPLATEDRGELDDLVAVTRPNSAGCRNSLWSLGSRRIERGFLSNQNAI